MTFQQFSSSSRGTEISATPVSGCHIVCELGVDLKIRDYMSLCMAGICSTVRMSWASHNITNATSAGGIAQGHIQYTELVLAWDMQYSWNELVMP